MIKQRLDQLDIDYLYLDGSTPAAQRQKLVETFQKGEMSLFLISLKAGGSGLNLTAADYIIHLDPWWNPAVEDQATDRAYRIGQKNPVTIYKLIAKDTIEEKIVSGRAPRRYGFIQSSKSRRNFKIIVITRITFWEVLGSLRMIFSQKVAFVAFMQAKSTPFHYNGH